AKPTNKREITLTAMTPIKTIAHKDDNSLMKKKERLVQYIYTKKKCLNP
ncbi:7498_t:CDS:1, partial [Gigaspora rosea]